MEPSRLAPYGLPIPPLSTWRETVAFVNVMNQCNEVQCNGVVMRLNVMKFNVMGLGLSLIREEPLYTLHSTPYPLLRGGLPPFPGRFKCTRVPRPQENAHPPRTPTGPEAWSYSRTQDGGLFLMNEVPL